MAFHASWGFGNRKVTKLDAVSFGIPAYRSASGFVTCPQAGACAAVCYARTGFYVMPSVAKARERNLALTQSEGFVAAIMADLGRIRQSIIRVHDSGDFYSQAYLDQWSAIARAVPGKRFYAYTKSLHLDFSACPDHFRIIFSQGGKMDAELDRRKPHSRIFATVQDLKRAGYANGSVTDTHAIRGTTKIGLVYHGTRSLTDAQARYFA